MTTVQQPTARTLDDVVRGDGTTATFRAGLSGQTHQWMLRSPSGDVLAETVRVHRGGPIRRFLWTLWNMANMHVGDDIHVELRGADGAMLARLSSENDDPAVVTVRDSTGAQLARSVRADNTVTVFGTADTPIATLQCDDDGPWQAIDPGGRVVGELVAGKPDPTRKPGLAQWVLFTDFALDRTVHQNGQHLGIRRVARYSYAAVDPSNGTRVLALLPLLAGLSY
jgi:hypothetical protein